MVLLYFRSITHFKFILDYLGLDHIGHVEGPFSKLVPSKLKEMDQIIELIHERLLDWVSFVILLLSLSNMK